MKKNDGIFDLCNFLFDIDQNATISLLTYLGFVQFLALR